MKEIIRKIERLEKLYAEGHTKGIPSGELLHILKARTEQDADEEERAIMSELARRYSAQEIATSPPIIFVQFI